MILSTIDYQHWYGMMIRTAQDRLSKDGRAKEGKEDEFASATASASNSGGGSFSKK